MDQSHFLDYFENGMKILNSLLLIEYSDNNPNIIWFGPDFFNLLGFCKEDLDSFREQPRRLLDSISHYITNFSDEVFNREMSYYRYLLNNFITDAEFNNIFQDIKIEEKKEDVQKFGYAYLKGKSVTYYMKQLRIVIGRSTRNAKYR